MRRYTLGRRQAAVDETRGRILRAARRLLLAKRGADFSLDAVARRARVTRLTVYHQFGSRRGLLEALFDDMAAKGGLLDALPNAFRQADPEKALARFVATFGHFWAEGRPIVRRLQALGVLDPELGKAIAGRMYGSRIKRWAGGFSWLSYWRGRHCARPWLAKRAAAPSSAPASGLDDVT